VAGGGASRVFLGRGALRVEARLLAEVRQWHEAVRADPARLARPLCILVPSRSLKDHVSATLVREIGTLAGVVVQTHQATALQILGRAGLQAPAGAQLLPVLVRQRAREVPVLRVDLDDLDDGYGAVLAAASDLLDAGLDEATAAPVRERLAAERGSAWTRAAGVVDVALAVQTALREHGLGRLPDVLVRAREALEAEPAWFAPGRLVVHGFADATGLVSEFVAALLRGRSALVLLDRPPDPANPAELDLGASFVAPLAATLSTTLGSAPELDDDPAPERPIARFRASGTDAEVRAVARRIEALLAADVRPEGIGIVMRMPALYTAALRTQLARLGIPASGVAVSGPRSVLGRRVVFLLELLRKRERIPADRLVLALARFDPGERADLRLGLHASACHAWATSRRSTWRLASATPTPFPCPCAGGSPRRATARTETTGARARRGSPRPGTTAPRARARGVEPSAEACWCAPGTPRVTSSDGSRPRTRHERSVNASPVSRCCSTRGSAGRARTRSTSSSRRRRAWRRCSP